MGVFNALEFDGINSLDYGVYITGEAVFNSPQRAVEAVTVPGRNGDVLLDLGRYENIEVTYHAGVFGVDQSQFATKIRAFRNMLASKVGYKRIVDTYNPTEYRLGTFVAPVDVTPSSMNRHGEFDIVFNCKPQRFLMDGENAIAVTDGQSVFNPTPFDAQPLIEVEGYGTLEFNGFSIDIENATIGRITLIGQKMISASEIGTTNPYVTSISFDKNLVNIGDTIVMRGSTGMGYYGVAQCHAAYEYDETTYKLDFLNESYSNVNVNEATCTGSGSTIPGTNAAQLLILCTQAQFVVGTESEYISSCEATIPILNKSDSSATGQSAVLSSELSLHYDGDSTITITFTRTIDSDPLNMFDGLISVDHYNSQISLKQATANSSATILGHPTYIDCELGEAYMIKNGSYISLNEYIDLGSDLPALAPGNNDFTFDDSTMTEVKIVPRWWVL